jgi:hypothetical protein
VFLPRIWLQDFDLKFLRFFSRPQLTFRLQSKDLGNQFCPDIFQDEKEAITKRAWVPAASLTDRRKGSGLPGAPKGRDRL